jgi:aspartyl aminopeptidase
MLPIGALAEKEDGEALPSALAEKLSVAEDAILDFDLFAYLVEEPKLVGFHQEWLSAPRLDDLVMVSAGLDALIEAPASGSVNLLALMDHEEVGSETAQGADSSMLRIVLEKISLGLGRDREAFLKDLGGSFMISADVAHAVHPAHPEKHDPVLTTRLGGGPVIKISARQSYVTRSSDYSVYEEICRQAGVPVQKFVNRSDSRGGSTMGPMMAKWIPCRSMDMGIALLSMHSARELMAVSDYEATCRSFVCYYGM